MRPVVVPQPCAQTRDLLWLLGLGVLLIAAGMGLRDPWPADEPRFALIARDMVLSGNWLFPQVGGDLYADKPPLFMWLIAAGYKLTGSTRIAFLLPSLLASLGTLALVYDLGRRLWSRETARWATVALLFAVQFTLQAKRAQIDMTLVFLTTVSLYALARYLLLGAGLKWWALGGFAAGLGVITKGVGFLPFLMLLPYAYARHKKWELPRIGTGWAWAVAPLAFLAAIAVWLVPMLMAVASSGDPALLAYKDEILFHQTAQRYAAAWHHHQPFYYYITVILSLWLPLALLIPWLAPCWKARLQARDPRVLLLLGWILLVLVFFSLSPGKRGVYIFPALPALALLSGEWLRAASHRVQRNLRGVAWAFGILWMSVSLVLAPKINGERSARDFMARVQSIADPKRELALMEYKEQFLLYLTRPVVNFGHRRWREGAQEAYDAARWLNADASRQLLVSGKRLKLCFGTARESKPVGEASDAPWFLVSGPALASCAEKGGDRVFRYDPSHPFPSIP